MSSRVVGNIRPMAPCQIVIAQHLEMTRGKMRPHKAPTTGIVKQYRHRHNNGKSDRRTDHEIEISDRGHARHGGEENDEGRHNPQTHFS